MGFLKKVGRLVLDATDLSSDSSHALMHRQDAPPVAIRPDASSLADLHTLAATSGGRAGRAIVQWTGGVPARVWGDQEGRGSSNVDMILRTRELDGGFGPCVQESVMLPREAGLLIGAGLEVPIIRDPTTGELKKVDRERLLDELRPLFAETKEADRAQHSIRGQVNSVREAVSDLRKPAPPTEPPETVIGVTADQWLQARRVLGTGRVPDAIIDRTLAAYGIPKGRWPEVDAAWSARAATDRALADRLKNL
jgi:hypothetical protein